MRFLADMGVSPRCVEWLREHGHNAVHLYEEKLQNLSDKDILSKARDEERILLTMDLDYAQLISATGSDELPTVVIFRLSDQRPSTVQERLAVLMPTLNKWINAHAIISVGDQRIRFRALPIR